MQPSTHSPGLLLLADLSKLLKPGGHNPVSLTHCHFLGVPSSLSALPRIYLHWLGFIYPLLLHRLLGTSLLLVFSLL